MRLFWAGFLMTGLMLVVASTYERQVVQERGGGGAPQVKASEDGTGFPYPHPTPPPKTR
jgi:hypothetical protein